jgi:hypothetical protein
VNRLDDLEKLLRRPFGVDAFVVIYSGPKETHERVYRMLNDVNLPTVIVCLPDLPLKKHSLRDTTVEHDAAHSTLSATQY